MSFANVMTSFGRSVVILVAIGAAFASGCAGKSAGDDDDEEDGDNGGSSSVGGTAGAFGGTGSGQTSCVSVCERSQVCAEATPVDCAGECRLLENEAAATGCTAELRTLLVCVGQSSDLCNAVASGECQNAAEDYVDCMDGVGGTGNCTSGVVTTGDCTTICQRSQACPGVEQTDCAATCSDQLAAMAELGCSREYQAMLGCASTCTNVCAVSDTDCAYELENLSLCASI